ncbi:Protein Pet117 [Trypanosoma melophagium]|uniref:Protein Pet117 n=1 Tax=Trypanosoma melophagium TaxID=715481 RepID=UPI003519FBB3|nr:Protein Pet117 [Trypanosoma melophagium]
MNSYARLFSGDQGVVSSWVGWSRPRDKYIFFGSIIAAIAMYVGISYNEEKERKRRHQSIEKDIERERWRAQQLGLETPKDDGFAERYIQRIRQNR